MLNRMSSYRLYSTLWRSSISGLALLLAAANASAQPARSDAATELQVYVGGTRLGSEEVAIERTAEGWTVSGTGQLAAPLDLVTRRLRVRYAADWRPIELQVDATSRGAPLRISTTFQGTTATSEVLQAGKTTTKTDQVSADALVLPNLFFGAYEALAARLGALEGDSATLPAYIAPQAEIQITVKRLEPQTIETTRATLKARRFGLTFVNPGTPLDAELWIDERGRLLRFEAPVQSLVVMRDDIAAVTTRRQNITRPGDETVRIPGNGFTLAGTVSKPSGPGDAKGRYPAIVLVPGSGLVDRDETVAGIPIFGQLAGQLADSGFVVLRYDKRGVGQSGGRAETATLGDYAEDARAAIRWLGRRKDVDDDRVALLGHSEGAAVALIAASRDKRIKAVVLVAGFAGTGGELVLEQQRHVLAGATVSDADRQARIDLQKRIQAAVLGQGEWTDVPDELRRQADTPWFQSFLAFSPAEVLPKVRQPILIVHGERDTQVPVSHADRLAELARSRKNSHPGDVAVVKVPGVNHLLVQAETGEVAEYARLTGRSVSPEVVKAITGWLPKAWPD
jgi:pimeloyl-ACP methyl ester carboxylesterase